MNANPAPAGAGTPVLNPADLCGCSAESSRALKRASRSAQQTASASAAIHPNRGAVCSDHKKRIKAGAVPNAMLSLNESSSAPNLLCARSNRAMRPSSPSSTPASTIAPIAFSQSLKSPDLVAEIAKPTPVSPKHRASVVIALGIIARNGIRRGSPSSIIGWYPSPECRGRRCRGSSLRRSRAAPTARAERPSRQEDVDAAAEADQADPLARHDHIAFAHEGDDPAGDEAGDLRKADLQAVRTFDQQMLALVVFAGFVEIGVDELARHISDAPHPSRDRSAV